jgi:hypothetical protein
MIDVDQNSATDSLARALVPGDTLVDGRRELDRLCFLSEFASLINFYDHTNMVNGSWKPFLLKDPVFLLAHISQTRFDDIQSRFTNTGIALTKFLYHPEGTVETAEEREKRKNNAIYCSNNLFNQLCDVFIRIERWTYYMQRSPEYDLRTYVLNEVKNNISGLLWAMLSCQDYVALAFPDEPLERAEYGLFENYDEITWKQSANLQPFWILLGISEPAARGTEDIFDTLAYAYEAITNTAGPLFRFFYTIVQHASPGYEKIKGYQSRYPDTTLLRTFTSLLQVHQAEQNGLAAKHLQFYYKDILQQTEKNAVADTAYLCATLAKPGATYRLPANTFFDAGVDANGNQVVFANQSAITLNPATISALYTVRRIQNGDFSTFYVNNIPGAGAIQKDQQGAMLSWDTFGGASVSQTTEITTGFAIASPVLLLAEGTRTVTCELDFSNTIDLNFFQAAAYFLSTANGWHQVTTPQVLEPTPAQPNRLELILNLAPQDPPIDCYPTNPEGFSAGWPMLKIVFRSYTHPDNPPMLVSATINVDVKGLQTLQLYNDYGLLNTKTPYQAFGPMPLVNSSFMIGSGEIFSKQLGSLFITLTWDTLPPDFQNYYQAYNNYLQTYTTSQAAIIAASKKAQAEKNKTKGWLAKAGAVIAKIFAPVIKLVKFAVKGVSIVIKWVFSSPAAITELPDTPYNNTCFTVDFSVLGSGAWSSFTMNKYNQGVPLTLYQIDSNCTPEASSADINNTLLFSTTCIPPPPPPPDGSSRCCVISDTGYFGNNSITGFVPDESIQHTPLKLSNTSSSGFLRMTLTGPDPGFGSALYPNVVANIALQNGFVMRKMCTGPDDIIASANPPFVPKLIHLSADYTASQLYSFTAQSTANVQCFVYSAAATTMVYDNTDGLADKTASGIPLFTACNYDGALFLNLTGMVVPATIDLYFQLAVSYGNTSGNPGCNAASNHVTIQCFFTENGIYYPVTILSDGTNGFRCSGIVTLSIGEAPGSDGVITSGKGLLAITVTGNMAGLGKTVFIGTNGFAVQRTGTAFLTDNTAPVLSAGSITKPVVFIPQIGTVAQFFASVGGQGSENATRMNQRVSNRMKTKDRAVSTEDFYRLIDQNFDDVFYSKAVYTADNDMVVYLVKAIADATDANAFLPLVTECRQLEITDFLTTRSSAFTAISVCNFAPEYVQVQAYIDLVNGYSLDGVVKAVGDALNIFLSPWIDTGGQQISIDNGISDADVISFIGTIEGVAEVVSVSFKTGPDMGSLQPNACVAGPSGIVPSPCIIRPAANSLFVPATTHSINKNPGVA